MSSMEPTVTRETVGQIGQDRPISTLCAWKAACMSLAGRVFQSTMNMLASVGRTFRPRFFRCSSVIARASCISRRRARIWSSAVRLAVAQASDGSGSAPDCIPPS
jgi:hypothetical protein